jgi:hypothetical protein
MLRLIKTKGIPKLAQCFGLGYIQNETQLGGFITFVHHVAQMSGKVPVPLVEETQKAAC